MFSEVLSYVGNGLSATFSHYEAGNEVFIRNINGKFFYCQRLNLVTQLKSNRILAISG
jgi:hypothetical protein